MSLIKIENASLGYEGKTVVNDISVDIKEKDYICIVGENGSGKTTLMKALLGLLKPLSGSITYSDGLKQNEIGYLPQSSDIQRDFPASVQEVVLSGCLNKKHTFFYSKEQKKTAAENMKLTGIYDLRKKCFRELSGGQRRRIDIARALLHRPQLLILDEPTTGLDPQTRKLLGDVVNDLRKNESMTVLLTTHYMEEAADADYVVILDSGKIVAEGTPLELKNKYTGDFITIYEADESEIKKLGMPYEILRDAIRVSVPDTAAATKIITENPKMFTDYEVTKGKMDDVFLTVTGRKLTGGDEK